MPDRFYRRQTETRLEQRSPTPHEAKDNSPPPSAPQTNDRASERDPAVLHGPEFERVRETWTSARIARDPHLPEFTRALEAHARHARHAGVGVADVLQSLNSVIRPERGGEPALDWDDVRGIAGKVVIRAYYRDD